MKVGTKEEALQALERAHDAVAHLNASGAYRDIVNDLRIALCALDDRPAPPPPLDVYVVVSLDPGFPRRPRHLPYVGGCMSERAMSHTPGPWDVSAVDRRTVVCGNGDAIADVHKWRDTDDARLIAAAPDLLAALKLAIPDLYNYDSDRNYEGLPNAAIEAAEAAIAKAEGK